MRAERWKNSSACGRSADWIKNSMNGVRWNVKEMTPLDVMLQIQDNLQSDKNNKTIHQIEKIQREKSRSRIS